MIDKEELLMVNVKELLIALDDGHGMFTPGKRTPWVSELGRFVHENEFNRAVVKYMDAHLRKIGFKTLLVAPTDADTSLTARTNLANQKGADAYVSIHYDALDGVFNSNDPEGLTVFYQVGSTQGKKLATSIHKYLKQGTKQKDRGVKSNNLHVTRATRMPAILSENGFMDNRREAILMTQVSFQKEVADEHVRGICDYFGVAYKPLEETAPKPASKPAVSKPEPKPAPKPVAKKPVVSSLDTSLKSSRVESKVDSLKFYSKPSWDAKDSVGTVNKGLGFIILGKLKVDGAFQYKVKNSSGKVFYITASDKFVKVEKKAVKK